MVSIGCIGDWVLLYKKKHDAEHHRRERYFAIAVAIGVTMDVCGLAHAIPSALTLSQGIAGTQMTNSWLVASNVLAARQVEELRATNLTLRHELLAFESNNLALRSNIVALEEQAQPRSIEISRPAQRLKRFAGKKAVIIPAMWGDCSRTANQIGEILHEANWDVSGIPTFKPVPDGVTLCLCWPTNGPQTMSFFMEQLQQAQLKSQDACDALLDELNKGSIAAKLDRNMFFRTSLRIDAILIFVGPKPNQTDAEVDRMENELSVLERTIEGIRLDWQPLIKLWTNQTMPRGLDVLFSREQAANNERNALERKLFDLREKQIDVLFPGRTTNSDGTPRGESLQKDTRFCHNGVCMEWPLDKT